MEDFTRRQFLQTSAALSAVVCTGGCFSLNPVPSVDGPASDLAGRIQFVAADFPALAKAGGAVTMQSSGYDQPVLVMHLADSSYQAVSAICTHLGCTVSFRDDKQIVECPCHGGRYGVDGQVLRAPPLLPLVSYSVAHDPTSDKVTIDSRTKFYAGVVNGTITLTPSGIGLISFTGGQLTYYPAGFGGALTVLAVADNTYATLAGSCTFGDCLLTFDGTQLNCPCHGCAFALDGSVKNGPASVALQSYANSFDGTSLLISV